MWNFDVTEIGSIRVRSAPKFGDKEILTWRFWICRPFGLILFRFFRFRIFPHFSYFSPTISPKKFSLILVQDGQQAGRRPADGRPNGYYSSNISINFGGKKVGEKWKNGGTSEKLKTQKRIRPRRVPTDGDSESGRTQRGKKRRKFQKGKKRKRIRPNGRQIRNLQVEISTLRWLALRMRLPRAFYLPACYVVAPKREGGG